MKIKVKVRLADGSVIETQVSEATGEEIVAIEKGIQSIYDQNILWFSCEEENGEKHIINGKYIQDISICLVK